MAVVILGKFADAFIASLSEKLVGEIWTKLQGDPAKNAIKQALGSAIQEYAKQNLRLDLARPLLQQDGLLTEPDVVREITQIIHFQREPNYNLIGQRWKAFMDNSPGWCSFTDEAKRLVEYFRVELQGTDVFRPVFDSRNLDVLAINVTTSTKSLHNIEDQLAELTNLMASRFEILIRYFSAAVPSIREEIRDYSWYIKEKTQDFIGRQYIFDSITSFTEINRRGYFFIQGAPGMGLTSLAAQMVKTNGYVHHFNIKSEGICTAEAFLRNVCAQLIARYKLNYASLPPEATRDGGFLSQLLAEISAILGTNEKAMIVISGLDDVDSLSPGTNLLYLPQSLPQGIYIIATGRAGTFPLYIECEQYHVDIGGDFPAAIADCEEYIKRAIKLPGTQAYIVAQGINDEGFIKLLIDKSGSNFMYLRYVLPEIERGTYTNLELAAFPDGLMNFYEDHWQRMRGKDQASWFEYQLPILMALTVLQRPVSIDEIVDISRVRERVRILATLQEWAPYLHEELVVHQSKSQKRYSVYHRSFYHFLTLREEIKYMRADRKRAL